MTHSKIKVNIVPKIQLSQLDASKAPGLDGIRPILLKKAAPESCSDSTSPNLAKLMGNCSSSTCSKKSVSRHGMPGRCETSKLVCSSIICMREQITDESSMVFCFLLNSILFLAFESLASRFPRLGIAWLPFGSTISPLARRPRLWLDYFAIGSKTPIRFAHLAIGSYNSPLAWLPSLRLIWLGCGSTFSPYAQLSHLRLMWLHFGSYFIVSC